MAWDHFGQFWFFLQFWHFLNFCWTILVILTNFTILTTFIMFDKFLRNLKPFGNFGQVWKFLPILMILTFSTFYWQFWHFCQFLSFWHFIDKFDNFDRGRWRSSGGDGRKSGWVSNIFTRVIVCFQSIWELKSTLHFLHYHFCSCNFVTWTDIYINQGLYTTWGGSNCSESSWNTLLLVCVFWGFCPMQQKTIPVEKYEKLRHFQTAPDVSFLMVSPI